MKILYFHPVQSPNLGDDITFLGSKNLITKAIGNHEYKTYYTEDPDEFVADQVSNFDALVISGTPWIWDRCKESGKYKVVELLLNEFKDRKKIALGIGSSYPLRYIPKELDDVSNIWKEFDFIHTRDTLASGILNSAQIANYYSYCTSAYADIYQVIQEPKSPALVYYFPEKGTASGVLSRAFIKYYHHYLGAIREKYNPRIIIIGKTEQQMLADMGLESTRPQSPEELINLLAGSKFVVSGRVHAAIPAAMLGIPTYILPIDSRSLTAQPFGIMPLTKELYRGDPNLHIFNSINLATSIKNQGSQIVTRLQTVFRK